MRAIVACHPDVPGLPDRRGPAVKQSRVL